VVTNISDTDYCRRVRRAAEASPRREAIVLLPLLSRSEMIALQRTAVVGVSLLRGTELDTMLPAPNKFAEYVHAGLLVVTNRSPFTERLSDRGVARIADSFEPCAIARQVDRAIEESRASDVRKHVFNAAQSWYCMDVQLSPVLQAIGLSPDRSEPRPET
jgi:hypothetical protein